MPSPRQTVTYLTQRFREVGLEPDSRHGQNFLIDLNLIELLARTADVGPRDVVLEVGTGTGSLTAMLAPEAAAVVTVEIDAHLYQIASQTLAPFNNVVMLQQDVLRNKNNLHATVLETIAQQVAVSPDRRLKLAANLPYNVATPIISNLLLTDITPYSMTITIQKELAERLAARPSTKDYGALSIWVQSQCEVELVRILPPQVFWPRPKVHSAIVHLTLNEERRAATPDLRYFHQFVRGMFLHRRKFLRSVMVAAYKGKLTKPDVDEIMAEHELGADARSEQLSVDAMLALCESARRRCPEW